MASGFDDIIAGFLSAAFLGGLLWVFNVPVSLGQFSVMLVLFLGISIYAKRTGEITIGFGIVTLGVILVVAEFLLPEFIVDPLARAVGAFGDAIGLDVGLFGQMSSLDFLVVAVAFTALLLGVRLRITRQKVFLRPLIDQVLREFARYLQVYINTARLVVLFSFAAIVVALGQAGQIFGEMGNVIGEVPFVAGNIFTGIAGYLSLGGELPIIGSIPLLNSLDAAGFAVLVLMVLAVAAAARWEGSGPLSNFLRR